MSESKNDFDRCMQAIYLAAESEVADEIVRIARAEVDRLTAERDEATALLRQSVDLISAGVLASVFGGEMTPQAEERINRLVDDLRAFLKKTEGDAS